MLRDKAVVYPSLLYCLHMEKYVAQVSQLQVTSKGCALGFAPFEGQRRSKSTATWNSLAVHPEGQKPIALITDRPDRKISDSQTNSKNTPGMERSAAPCAAVVVAGEEQNWLQPEQAGAASPTITLPV